MQNQDEIFMKRALQLAEYGKCTVAPNPRVGAVIVYQNKIVGEGFHQSYGKAHAEVNAINSVKDKSILSESTIYVTLEPCSHYGKTPPCADLLIKHQFKRVVLCNLDPFKKVNGSGIKKLQAAKIPTTLNTLSALGHYTNRRFFTFHKHKRPFIILKWAETKDGFIYSDEQANNWISNSISKQLVHQWRAEEDAILVGKNTVLTDNPELTTRDVFGTNPVRIIIDKKLELPSSKKIFNTNSPTFVLNEQRDIPTSKRLTYSKAELGQNLAKAVCQLCYQNEIQSIIVEGGHAILTHFIETGMWDEARIFKGNRQFNHGIQAPIIKGKKIAESTILSDHLRILINTLS